MAKGKDKEKDKGKDKGKNKDPKQIIPTEYGSQANELVKQFFPEGSLGRVSSGVDANGNRIGETQDVLDRFASFRGTGGPVADTVARLKAGLEGYTADENTAMREAADRQSKSAYETNISQLAKTQARSGVRGASANAQMANIAAARQKQVDENAQNLMIKNADEKQKRLESYAGYERQANIDYANALQGQRTDELNRSMINLDKVAAERGGQTGTFFQGVGLGLTRDQQDRDEELAKQYIAKL